MKVIILEMNLDLKNPPDWTPPPTDMVDDGDILCQEGDSGVGASGRGENQVRLEWLAAGEW